MTEWQRKCFELQQALEDAAIEQQEAGVAVFYFRDNAHLQQFLEAFRKTQAPKGMKKYDFKSQQFRDYFMDENKENQINQTEKEIKEECNALAQMLIEKNRAYGDSALSPRRIFSRADPLEQIKVRIDDKLSRLINMRGDVDSMGEDVARDLLGYLILLMIARRRKEVAAMKQYVPAPVDDEDEWEKLAKNPLSLEEADLRSRA